MRLESGSISPWWTHCEKPVPFYDTFSLTEKLRHLHLELTHYASPENLMFIDVNLL
jgi:hypothetical protein